MGELINLNPPKSIADADIPAAIARDTEIAAAMSAHVAAIDPHAVYLTQAEGDGRYRQTTVALTDTDIPAAITRDTEVTAAINAHVAASDPHPVYLTQAEGDGRYRQTTVALTDTDIPAAIARDSETTAAINAHVAIADPHPSLWIRIANAFLAITGGQFIIKNNPATSPGSYLAGQNHLEFRTNDGSNPTIGFHRAGFTATALYHLGYGNNSLRIRNADGFDGAIVHDGNIGDKIAGSAKAVLVDGTTVLKTKILRGTTASTNGGMTSVVHGLNLNNIVGFEAVVFSTASVSGAAFSGRNVKFDIAVDATNVTIILGFGDCASILAKPVTILIRYIE